MTVLWMKTTKDKYELPLAVADSVAELSQMVGTKREVISCAVCRKYRGWDKVILPETIDWDDEEDVNDNRQER